MSPGMTLATLVALLPPPLLVAAEERRRDGKEVSQPVQEVFQTELVYPQEKGEFQLTLSSSWKRVEELRALEVPLGIEYGITESWQLSVEWRSLVSVFPPGKGPVQGIGDLEIATQRSFMSLGRSNFHAAVGLAVGFPTGDSARGLGEGAVEYEPYLLLARDFPALGRLQLFGQVAARATSGIQDEGPGVVDRGEAPAVDVHVGMLLPLRFLVLTTELTGIGSAQKYLLPGMVWLLPGRWELGVGAALGLTGASDDFRLLMVTTYEF